MSLSVVIACYADNAELDATVRSIHETTIEVPEIIVVDDASPRPVQHVGDKTRIIRTARRIGVGPARYLGALHASGTHILFIDSHSRFEMNSWLAFTLEAINRRPAAVHCGVCLGLGFNGSKEMNMDVNKPNAVYHGATWTMYGPDRKFPNQKQVFESIWADKRDDDDYELAGIMGACYVVPRLWYAQLNCGRHLVSYGCDEQELALKTWLAGGEVRMLKGLRVGHLFKEAKKMTSGLYGIPYNASSYVLLNKIFLILTLLPKTHADILLSKLRQEREYLRVMRSLQMTYWPVVEIERARNVRLFTRDFNWFLDHFGLTFPGK